MDYIIVNGEILKKQETGFTSFFWTEPFVVTQKIWFGFGGIPMFFENIEEIKTVLQTLNIEIPDLLNDEHELFRITKRMLNKNRFFRSGIITIQVYISKTETNTIISSFAFSEFDFPVSKEGLLINFSEFKKFSTNPLNQFSFFNNSFWEFAKGRNHETTFKNSILLNEKSAVCECISSNIFLIKSRVIYTPSVLTGCYIDSLRNLIIESARKSNLTIEESEGLGKEDVIQMDEIFLASEEHGIQLILGAENKRFVHNYSRKIHQNLNEYLKNKVK
jgi:hypothetical protein